jgi:hypothetical protein
VRFPVFFSFFLFFFCFIFQQPCSPIQCAHSVD